MTYISSGHSSLVTLFNINYMIKLLFFWYTLTGVVTPLEEVDGRMTYTIKDDDSYIEYAYKGEVLQWIDSGTFVYDETLQDY